MLETVTVCDGAVVPRSVAAKVKLVGESEMEGDAATDPLSATVCEPRIAGPFALSAEIGLAVSPAEDVPAAVGLKAIESVQLAPAANEGMQVLPVHTKEAAFAPVNKYDLTVTAAAPVLLTVMVCGAEVAPTSGAVKVRLAGDNV